MSAPSASTQSLPHPWLRRYGLAGAIAGPLVTAAATTLAGMQWQDLKLTEAFKQLGLLSGTIVALVAALVWTYGVFVPRLYEEHAKSRQMLADLMNASFEEQREERSAFREAVDVFKSDIADMKATLTLFMQRNDRKITAPVRTTGPIERVNAAAVGAER